MPITLLDTSLEDRLVDIVRSAKANVWICSPWIKQGPAERILSVLAPSAKLRVLTRGVLEDFLQGASDLPALERLLARGHVAIARNLHAKAYLGDSSRLLLGSANLTNAATNYNLEMTVETRDASLIQTVTDRLEGWDQAARTIDTDWIAAMRRRIQGVDPDTTRAEATRARDLEGPRIELPWVVPAVDPAPVEPQTDAADAAQRETLPVWAEWPLPTAWLPLLDELMPTLPISPVPTTTLTIKDWPSRLKEALTDRVWEILEQRRFEDLTLEAIGQQLQVSRQRVEQLEAKGVVNARNKDPEFIRELTTWLGALDSSLIMVCAVPKDTEKAFCVALGLGEKASRRTVASMKLTVDTYVLFEKKRIERVAALARKKASDLGYATKAVTATELSIAEKDLDALRIVFPDLMFETKSGLIGFHCWTKQECFKALAIALARRGFPSFHSSELYKAAARLNPDDFHSFSARDANALVQRSGDFAHLGRKGTWSPHGFSDGFQNTLKAIEAVFDEHGPVLHGTDIHSLLKRDVTVETVTASLANHDELFEPLGRGLFRRREAAESHHPEGVWLRNQLAKRREIPLKELQERATAAGLNPLRLRGIAGSHPDLEVLKGSAQKPAAIRLRTIV